MERESGANGAVVKTLRYRDPESGQIQLGLVREGDVYSVTRQVPDWTDPLPMWRALQALGISAAEAADKLAQGQALVYEGLEREGLLLPPVAAKEVWAAGVTYERSREARNAETQLQDSVYDRVYEAERPELFFKATGERVTPPGRALHLRSDSRWMVPEPELSLVVTAGGAVVGWTIGDDLSSRDIEGQNPLYLPQAKVFCGSCSFGPVFLWNTGAENPRDWTIEMSIWRGDRAAFAGSVALTLFRRRFEDLVAYLLRDNPIPDGTVLMTGTGVVPPDDFTLEPGDVVEITVAGIGTLRNPVHAALAG